MGNDQWPQCQSCETGSLLPLSDFGGQGAAIHYRLGFAVNLNVVLILRSEMVMFT